MNFRLVIFYFLFLVPVLISCSSERKKEAEQKQKGAAGGGAARPPLRADVYIVKQKTIFDNLEIPGSVVANESTEIHPEVAGRITNIYFKEGNLVSKGVLLVKLNDADLQAQKQKLLVQIRIAEQNQNRSEQLLKIGGISRQDYENMELAVSSARADLAVTNTNIEKTNIRAPFTGKLGLRLVSPGAYVSPQTTLTTISQLNQMRVDFTIPEKYTGQVGTGRFINFKVEGSDASYSAKVIATESSIAENTRTLQVRAAVQGYQAGLVPGAFARVILSFEPDSNSIVVPSQAIIPEARGKKVYVYQDGVAKYTDVTTGIRDSANVQITSGLKVGDTVLITGLLAVKPNAKVIVGKVVNGTTQLSHQGGGKKPRS